MLENSIQPHRMCLISLENGPMQPVLHTCSLAARGQMATSSSSTGLAEQAFEEHADLAANAQVLGALSDVEMKPRFAFSGFAAVKADVTVFDA